MVNKYIFSLQALRAIAFLCILTYHCGLTPLGPWGVSVFFILSGFVLVLKYHDKELPCSFLYNIKFAISSVKKIYLLHILTMIAIIIRDYIQFGVCVFNFPKFLSNIFLVSSWFPQSMGLSCYNGVAWFLSSILFSYFMFPLLLRVVKNQSVRGTKTLIVLILFIQAVFLVLLRFLRVSNEYEVWLTFEHPIFRLGDFLLGMNLCLFYIKERKKNVPCATSRETLCFGVLAICCIVDMVYFRPHGYNGFRKTLLYSPLAMLMLYYFAMNQGLISKLFTSKTLVYMGNMSGLYFLIHQFVVYNTKWALFGAGPWGGLKEKVIVCMVSFIATILLAFLYKHIQNRIYHKFKLC